MQAIVQASVVRGHARPMIEAGVGVCSSVSVAVAALGFLIVQEYSDCVQKSLIIEWGGLS